MDRPLVMSEPGSCATDFVFDLAPDFAGECRVSYSSVDRRPLVARSTDRVEGPAKAGGPRR